ncbi:MULTISPECIES: glycosyltransferase family 2 protein [Glaesserella]|uniref:Glycosyltransferase DcbB n=1 Tax=Glaesserella australis TaxID=2094024 RepID=A0A328C0S7_9PAST|nr:MULTISPECIES: glycosyltransferase family 2 protein [Glaesserella]AUI66409.1 glycosyltransferase DcbB [Glaesserella sp. 15-184]RAL19377.1 glycosyltransferase DcbB [Glaesserella australis]
MPRVLKKFFLRKKNNIELLLSTNSKSERAVIFSKMGLYRTILANPEYKNTYPYIISLYACGYSEQAKVSLDKYIKTESFSKNKVHFILSILPFDKDVAYSLLDKSFDVLSIANILSQRNDLKELSDFLLSLDKKAFKAKPELYLLYNFITRDTNSKLNNLNRYLVSYHLDKIELLDLKGNLFVTNLKNKELRLRKLVNDSLPLVSIIVTTYNSQEYIISTLLSLVNQTYPNKEIIIIDDNSKDATIDIIQNMMSRYSFIRLIKLERNVGTYVAKTIGTLLSKGEFVTNNDSDDWAHPRKIELQIYPLLKNPKLVVSFSKWIRLKDDGTFYARAVSPLTRFNPSSALFRKKDVIEKTGLWNLVRTGADSEFNARLKLVFKDQYVMVNKPLTIGAHRENSLMTAKDTGYSPNGISLTRLQYWESWNYWHINAIKNNISLIIRENLAYPFTVPKEIMVNKDDILFCFEQFGIPKRKLVLN